jgi:hypothetical protein
MGRYRNVRIVSEAYEREGILNLGALGEEDDEGEVDGSLLGERVLTGGDPGESAATDAAQKTEDTVPQSEETELEGDSTEARNAGAVR